MAKKKKVDKPDYVTAIEKQMKASGFFQSATFIEETEHKMISISPVLDGVMDGGIRTGSFVLLSGVEGCGKTTTALQIAGNFQREGRPVFYQDVEHRFKKQNLRGVHNLDGEKLTVIQSAEDKILSGEEHLRITEMIIKAPENRGGLIIIDSMSSLCPAGTLSSDEVRGNRRSTTPRLTADFCRKVGSLVPLKDFTVIMIAHLQEDMSGYGGMKEDGGRFQRYQANYHLRCFKTVPFPRGCENDENRLGQIISWKIIKAGDDRPRKNVESILRYGYGLDDITELILECVDISLITKKASWYSIGEEDEEGYVRFQGMQKMFEYLRDSPLVLEELKEKYRSVMWKS